jgi:hypothetical protein
VTYPNATLVILGTGTIPTFAPNATFGIGPVPNASPMAIIGQPGITTNIDAGESGGGTISGTNMAFDLQNGSTDHFFDNIECTGGNQSSANWRFFSAPAGQQLIRGTWNEVSFPNCWAGTAPTDNAGPIELDNPDTSSDVSHTYIGVRGCSSTNATSSSNNTALFETYNCQYGCVELCVVTNSQASGGIGLKEATQDFTIQNCWVDSGTTDVVNLFWTGCLGVYETQNIEMRYCYAIGAGNSGNSWVMTMNVLAGGSSLVGQHWIYRCSLIGGMGMQYESGIGPLSYSVCAIQYNTSNDPFMINSGSGFTKTPIASLPSGVTYNGSQACIGTGSIINPATGNFESAFGSNAGLIGAPMQ